MIWSVLKYGPFPPKYPAGFIGISNLSAWQLARLCRNDSMRQMVLVTDLISEAEAKAHAFMCSLEHALPFPAPEEE